MNKKSRAGYWFAVLLTLGLMASYAHLRDLPGRYRKHVERERNVKNAQEEHEALSAQRDREEQRAQQLVTDPLEIESAIRKYKQRVRPGETVFRIEEVSAEGPGAPAPDR